MIVDVWLTEHWMAEMERWGSESGQGLRKERRAAACRVMFGITGGEVLNYDEPRRVSMVLAGGPAERTMVG